MGVSCLISSCFHRARDLQCPLPWLSHNLCTTESITTWFVFSIVFLLTLLVALHCPYLRCPFCSLTFTLCTSEARLITTWLSFFYSLLASFAVHIVAHFRLATFRLSTFLLHDHPRSGLYCPDSFFGFSSFLLRSGLDCPGLHRCT